MGSRINFVFDDGTDALTVLYSHYGETTWEEDLSAALHHAMPRQNSEEYFTRMIISYLIKDQLLDETGFGIYAVKRNELSDFADKVVVLDFVTKTVTDLDNQKSIPFYSEVLV